MLRDNLVELIEPMLNSAGADPLALYIHTRTPASDDRLPCLKNPRPEGAESSLTESASSPFQAEPAHHEQRVVDIELEKTLRGKVGKQTFPLRLGIPQKTRDSHFPTAATTTALRLHFKWRDDPPHGYILKWLDASGTRILGTNIRRGAAAPCCDPHLTVASSARRYCGAFTELSITAALTSTGTRILGTNIDLLSSFLRLSSDRSRCIGLRSEEHTSELQSLAYLVC